jgi:hypothetical protein
VRRVNKGTQPIDSAIEISHLWKGAAPSFTLNPNKRVSDPNPLIRIKSEAKVWVRKYLIEASLESLDFFTSKIGMNAKVFNSNPIHAMNMEGDEITKKILVRILKDIRKIEGENHIREEV